MRIFLLLISLFLLQLGYSGGGGTKPASPDTEAVTPEQAEQSVCATAQETVQALKEKDTAKLEKIVHPVKGVRFSPYAYIDTKTDIVLKAGDTAQWFTSPALYTWGAFDGSGEPIRMTIKEYYARFTYDHDFAAAEKIGMNQFIGRSTTANNLKEAYPDGVWVEYHFSGFDKSLEGHDWASLRLVFERDEGRWYLVGIVHDQWTI